MRYVEANAPGELLNHDTFGRGTLKGMGKVYVQVVIDALCSLAFAKVYTSKMPITSADLLYERVLPSTRRLGVEVKAVLTDHGHEFCGRAEQHPYELMLAPYHIDHRITKVASPRTNGSVERVNRTLLDACFRIARAAPPGTSAPRRPSATWTGSWSPKTSRGATRATG